MLDEARIKWRIIVVSACYSGGYIEPLKDDNTLIMTASAADRTSFGCGTESDATYFADALFQHALRFEDSFVKAFEQARAIDRRARKGAEGEPAVRSADVRRRRDGGKAAEAGRGIAQPPRRLGDVGKIAPLDGTLHCRHAPRLRLAHQPLFLDDRADPMPLRHAHRPVRWPDSRCSSSAS